MRLHMWDKKPGDEVKAHIISADSRCGTRFRLASYSTVFMAFLSENGKCQLAK